MKKDYKKYSSNKYLKPQNNNFDNLPPKLKVFMEEAIKKQEIRKKHWIWFWLFLCPPIGLYKSFKYKAFHKFVNWCVLCFMILSVIVGVDTVLNPNRVIDMKVKEKFEEVASEVRELSKVGRLDDTYYIYNIVANSGEYDVYLSTDGNLEIKGINQITPSKDMIFVSDDFPEELKNVYPEIIRFFNEEGVKKEFGVIIKVEDETLNDYQIISTTKGKFAFDVQYEQVVGVYEYINNSYEKVYQRTATIEMPKDVLRAIKKNKKEIGEVKDVLEYLLTNETQEYTFINNQHQHFKAIKYLDGSIELLKGQTSGTEDVEDNHNFEK